MRKQLLFCFALILTASQLWSQACPGLGSVTLTVVAAPQPTLSGGTFCVGNTTTLNVGGGSFANYAWAGPGVVSNTGASAIVNAAGTYTVTVTNASGCTATATSTVTQIASVSVNVTTAPYLCNGTFTLNATPGLSSYTWSAGGGTNSINVTSSGTYTVTVTNAQGCTGTDDINITIPPPISVAITGNTSLCASGNTVLSATAGFNSYAWSGGGTSQTRTVTTPGTYTVTVTGTLGCTGTSSVTVSAFPAPSVSVTSPTNFCNGSDLTLNTSGGPFNNYDWSAPGGNTPSLTVSNTGTYTVTITDANGCTATASRSVTEFAPVTPNIVASPVCGTTTATLSLSTPFPTVAWSTSGSGNTTSVSADGTYSVTVTDANGCTGSASLNVTVPTNQTVSISGNNSICPGNNTVLTATSGFNSYSWSGGGTGPTRTVNSAGTYTVTATDAFGCTTTGTWVVTAVSSPSVTISSPANFCNNTNLVLTATGGPFDNYNWSAPGGSDPTLTVSNSGTYRVTVTDANGCTATASQTVTELAVVNPTVAVTPVCATNSATLTVSPPFPTVAWSTGATGVTTSVVISDDYAVTVTDANGCTGVETFTVAVPSNTPVTISGTTAFCQGGSTVLTASTGFVSYVWSGGINGPNRTVTTAGTYTVTATDNLGCTQTSSITASTLAAPTPNITGPTSFCAGNSITLNAGAGFTDYDWNLGGNTSTITVTNSGNYIVTVTNAQGCTGTDSQAVTATPAPNPTLTVLPYTCNNTLTINAGTGFSAYAWSVAGSGSSVTITSNGLYTVTVTNAQGCTSSDVIDVEIPDPPFVTITGNGNLCSGQSTTLSATPGFNLYIWSNSAIGPSDISVTAPGLYEVTVSDNLGCTASEQFVVTALTAPVPVIAGPSSICATSTATFSVPGVFSQYAWSTNANTPTITTNQAGTYTVTVTAANGCTATDTQVLGLSNQLSPQIVTAPYQCNGQFVLDAGNGFTSYSWNVPQTSQTITVNASGNYTVTVSDPSGCSGTATIAIAIPAPPAVSIAGGGNICPGTNATLSATAGLNAYVWSNGEATAAINIATPNTYTVIATDAFGCTATATAVLGNFTAPSATITGPTSICTNASATLAGPAGLTNYAWSNSANTPDISVNTAGTYTLTVTDANGCTASASQNLDVLTALTPSITLQPYNCNGQITVDADGGFVSYAWSNAGATASTIITQSGTYTVTVTGAGGCTGTATVAITVPTISALSVNGGGGVCAGTNATLAASAGFVLYTWSNSETTASISVTTPNVYSVTATDALGCTVASSATLSNFAPPSAAITGPTSICTNSTATLAGPAGLVAYAWSNSTNTPSISVNTAGTYTLTVTDANGCTATSSQNLDVTTALSPTITPQPYACDGQITLTANSGFTNYAWSNNALAATNNVTQSGTYTVTVTGTGGCTGTATVAVAVPALPNVSITGGGSVCPGGNTTLNATAGFVSYAWTGGGNSNAINISTPNTYTVTATDAQGCTATATATLSNFAPPSAAITGPTSICTNATATLAGPAGLVAYAWSNSTNTPSISVNTAGTYTLTVTDANGCTATSSQNLDVTTALSPTITPQPYACDGQITLTANSGFTNYAWSNNALAATNNVTQSGTYTVTVTGTGGCTGTATVAVAVPSLPNVSITGGGSVCPGGNTTLNATAGFVSYAWTGGGNSNAINISTPNTYTVTATDAQGCTATATATLSNFAPPSAAITGPTSICTNATATLAGPAGLVAYAWSNSTNTPSISVNTAGTYTLTVTDANGCTATSSQNLDVTTALSPTITPQPYACDGQITLTANSGFTNYAWSNNALAATNNVTQSGTYTVTVTGTGGCTGTATVAVAVPALPNVSITGGGSVCPGGNTTLNATAGFVSYAWTGGGNSNAINITTPNTYTVTATDAQGCTATATATLSNFAPPSAAITGPTSICTNATATLAGPAGLVAYAWSNSTNTPSISVNTAGTYTLTVTDANGCTASATQALNVSNALTPTITQQPYDCDGVITITTNGGFTNYAWSNNTTTATANITQNGTYTVTVTGTGGCTGTATISLTIPTSQALSIDGDEKICAGNTATLTASQGFATYAWSSGQTTAVWTGAAAGSYTVTVTDDFGCTQTSVWVVLPNPSDTTYLERSTCNPAEAGIFERLLPSFDACDSLIVETVTFTPVEVFVGDTLEVQRGAVVALDVLLPFVPSSINWSPSGNLSCDNCLTPTFSATNTITLAFEASDFGCEAIGTYLIRVKGRPNIYAPNAITPGDANNGGFTIFGDVGLINIKTMQIYDRWGSQMAIFRNLQPNDPNSGWDGLFNGQPVQPGVYIWWAEVEYTDGTVETIKGDITIIE
jgi:trimeric autotransporter adhesin